MKNIKIAVCTLALLVATSISFAQKVNEISGNLDILKGVKKMNVRFDYNHFDVGKKSEKEYVAEKKAAYNDKEAGKGDQWAKQWVADRAARFEPRFKEEFNNMNEDLQVGSFPNEKYTLIFKTVYTETGYNVGVSKRPAYIDGEVWIVETANPGKAVIKMTIENCPGRLFMGDYATGERLQEAYAMAGKGLSRYFKKNID